MALNNRRRPFILAYSQFIDEATEQRTKAIGFDACINSVLGHKEMKEVIHDHIDTFAYNFFEQRMSEKRQVTQMMGCIKQMNHDIA